MSSGEGPCHCKRCGYFSGYSYTQIPSMEGWFSCSACGYGVTEYLRYDSKGNVVFRESKYLIDGSVVMGLRDLNHNELLWKMSIPPNTKLGDIDVFINEKFRPKYLRDMINASPESIEFIEDEFNKINIVSFYKMDGINEEFIGWAKSFKNEFDKHDGGSFLIRKEPSPIRDIKNSGGFGRIYMFSKKGEIICDDFFENAISPKKALNIWHFHMSKNLNINKSFLTVWDEHQAVLVLLKGKIPEHDEDDE